MRDRPLCSTFPHLYHLSCVKNHYVVDVLDPSWSFPSSFGFRRPLPHRETKDVLALLSLIEKFVLRPGRKGHSSLEQASKRISLVNCCFSVYWIPS